TPTAAGAFTFTVQATAANGCTGTGSFTVTITPPPIVLTAAPASIDFGIVPAGTTATQTITLTNVSATPIVLTAPAITGADAARFSAGDRKSTRLNSSHLGISYAVFCLKKKKREAQLEHGASPTVLHRTWCVHPRLVHH